MNHPRRWMTVISEDPLVQRVNQPSTISVDSVEEDDDDSQRSFAYSHHWSNQIHFTSARSRCWFWAFKDLHRPIQHGSSTVIIDCSKFTSLGIVIGTLEHICIPFHCACHFDMLMRPTGKSFWQIYEMIVYAWPLEYLSLTAILLNAVSIGIETDIMSRNLLTEAPAEFIIFGWGFCAWTAHTRWIEFWKCLEIVWVSGWRPKDFQRIQGTWLILIIFHHTSFLGDSGIFVTLEMVLKISAKPSRFFNGVGWQMNIFDLTLVALQWLDVSW